MIQSAVLQLGMLMIMAIGVFIARTDCRLCNG